MLYCIITEWGYPFGGGEAFMYQTLEYVREMGMHAIWISFQNARTLEAYSKLNVIRKPFRENETEIVLVQVPGGFSIDSLKTWLKAFDVDIVHHQGHRRLEVLRVCYELRIPTITGCHFWNGILHLSPRWGNKQMIEHYKDHRVHEDWDESYKLATLSYVASFFMQTVIERVTNRCVRWVCEPVSSIERTQCPESFKTRSPKFVTMINLHRLKGGEVFRDLLVSDDADLLQVSFLGVFTEPCSENLDEEIRHVAETRQIENSAVSNRATVVETLLWERKEDVREIYSRTRILLIPSVVDETFCRVALEGLSNGIPILATRTGNLHRLLYGAATFLPSNDSSRWIRTIAKLYEDKNLLAELSRRSRAKYEEHHERLTKQVFRHMISSCLSLSPRRRLMFICPWGDQGLGIQVRHYIRMLTKFANFDPNDIAIFAFRTYFVEDILFEETSAHSQFQADDSEWKFEGPLYLSPHTREQITDAELSEFLDKIAPGTGTCIIPETCWFRLFEIAAFLKSLNLRVFGIPNVEITRRDELYKHRIFDGILCNNEFTMEKFNQWGFRQKTHLIGFGGDPFDQPWKTLKNRVDDKYRFLVVGGMNAVSRKQADKVAESFCNLAPELREKATLTITTQRHVSGLDRFANIEGIQIIEKHLTHAQIREIYLDHHIVILVSKHEGLGLGFFESMSLGRPVITLDTAPFNELIDPDHSGWLIPCRIVEATENPQSLIGQAIFKTSDLTKCFRTIMSSRTRSWKYVHDYCRDHYRKSWEGGEFCRQLLDAITPTISRQ